MPRLPTPCCKFIRCETAFITGTWPSAFHGLRHKAHSHSSTPDTPIIKTPHRPRNQRVKAMYGDELSSERSENDSSNETTADIDSEEYFKRLRALNDSERVLSNPLGLKKSYEIIRFDEDGIGPRDRYVYVEERDCIGCTYCATTAPGTFFIESEYGRARVYDQVGECETAIEEAIDTCPVNCIYYVDWTDLVNLENMRDEQDINNWTRLVGGQDYGSSRKGEKVTTVMDSGIMRCEDCPSRGCSQCPMYGVGENPEYLRKKAAREERMRKRQAGGGRKKTRRRL